MSTPTRPFPDDELTPQQKQLLGIQNLVTRNPYLRPSSSSFYRGPGLPPSYTDQINPPEKTDVSLIIDSIRQIVETRTGERLMQPSFGSRVLELIGEPLAPVFEQKVRMFLTDAIKQWEQRVQLLGVKFVYDSPNHQVTVTYGLQMLHLGTSAQATFKIPRS